MPDDFFIGYAPTPPGLRGWLRIAAVCAILVMLSGAILIAARQRSGGDGVWESGSTREVEGVYVEAPYPMLMTGEQILLLVGAGKVAASPTIKPGDRVRVSGTRLRRMNLMLFEATAFAATPATPPTARPPALGMSLEGQGPRTFHGEILDPKCFAGAMKPGDGKAHKACAALCIRGGIPPAFRSGDEIFLLVDPQLRPFDAAGLEAVIAHVGDDVELSGHIVPLEQLRLLAVDPKTIRRSAP